MCYELYNVHMQFVKTIVGGGGGGGRGGTPLCSVATEPNLNSLCSLCLCLPLRNPGMCSW